jgi:hypothetical protein
MNHFHVDEATSKKQVLKRWSLAFPTIILSTDRTISTIPSTIIIMKLQLILSAALALLSAAPTAVSAAVSLPILHVLLV